MLARLLLYATLALIMATLHHRLRETYAPYAGSRYDTTSIAEGRSVPPIQRRILVPLTAVKLHQATGAPLPQIELAIRTAALTVTLAALDALLVGLGYGSLAVVGPLLLACLLPLGFYVNPVIDSYPAMAVVALGLLLVQLRKGWWSLPLILVGAWIRESVLLIPVVVALHGLLHEKDRSWVPLCLAQLAGYAAMRLVLRWLYPGPDFDWTLGFNLAWVLEAGLAEGVLRLLVLFLPFALALWGLGRARGMARAMGWAGMLYGGGLLLVARLSEPRVFWDAYLLLTPGMVSGLLPFGRRDVE